MSGPTFFASSTTTQDPATGKVVTTGTFTFAGRQDQYALDQARRITRCQITRNQFRTGEPIRFTYAEGEATGTLL